MTAAQSQDRKEFQELAKQVAKLEVQVGESDKRLATKVDVERVIGSVQTEFADVKSDLRWLKWTLGIGVSGSIAVGVAVFVQVLRLSGG